MMMMMMMWYFCRSLWVTLRIANTKHAATQDDLTDGLLNLGSFLGSHCNKAADSYHYFSSLPLSKLRTTHFVVIIWGLHASTEQNKYVLRSGNKQYRPTGNSETFNWNKLLRRSCRKWFRKNDGVPMPLQVWYLVVFAVGFVVLLKTLNISSGVEAPISNTCTNHTLIHGPIRGRRRTSTPCWAEPGLVDKTWALVLHQLLQTRSESGSWNEYVYTIHNIHKAMVQVWSHIFINLLITKLN